MQKRLALEDNPDIHGSFSQILSCRGRERTGGSAHKVSYPSETDIPPSEEAKMVCPEPGMISW
jgi:hypothetical protein